MKTMKKYQLHPNTRSRKHSKNNDSDDEEEETSSYSVASIDDDDDESTSDTRRPKKKKKKKIVKRMKRKQQTTTNHRRRKRRLEEYSSASEDDSVDYYDTSDDDDDESDIIVKKKKRKITPNKRKKLATPKKKIAKKKSKSPMPKKEKTESVAEELTTELPIAAPPAEIIVGAIQAAKKNTTPSPVKSSSTTTTTAATKSTKNTTSKKSDNTATLDFRNLNLPIASFTIPGFEHDGPTTSSSSTKSNENQDTTKTVPFPKHVSKAWKKAVLETRKHKRFENDFDFQRYKETDQSNGILQAGPAWFKAKPYGDWCRKNPTAIAIDCEMCETFCPKTKAINPKALCRVSIIDADQPDQVLLDTLVKPYWPVRSHRTFVNGITKEHLKNVKFTMHHLHVFLKALCSEETIIVGHAVQNDLVAMRMEHHVHADSSFLFPVKDGPTITPSLKEIANSVFDRPMPDTHDSVNDARVANMAVLHWMEREGKVKEIVKKNIRGPDHQLNVSDIPSGCRVSHLEELFLRHAYVRPLNFRRIERGQTVVTFISPQHAILAFDSLKGDAVLEEEEEKRWEKKVQVTSSSSTGDKKKKATTTAFMTVSRQNKNKDKKEKKDEDDKKKVD